MNVFITNQLTDNQIIQIDKLWNEEYPVKFANRFGLLLEGADNHQHYLILDDAQKVMAWAVDFEKDKEVRFSIIVATEHQGKGLGVKLINAIKAHHTVFYGWVIDHDNDVKQNGKSYLSPLPFYLKQGFEVLHDTRLESEIMSGVKIKWETCVTS